MFRKYILPIIVFVFYRTLSWTWRVRLFEPESLKSSLENKNPVVLAHWHGDELALLSIVKRYRIATIASQSKDGELMATVLKWMGAKTSRGSSSRGSVQALKGLLRLVKDGGNCSFAVDGPKGPLHKVKPGVFELSRMIHGPIYAAGVYVDRAIYFPRSWNKTFLPKPFAKVIIVWSECLPPVTKEQDPRNPDLALELESLLHQTRQQAVNFIADNKA
ncbi:lysophospholipid acyltransferase family protein [Bdellovibrio sp. KM01]|uniref:lysophospholipid acyltransferase family protein n=1 Tax=Bdellovibrio sp. KM01 TaxID=2748865 RepID=UPI0015EA6416|nr:lysophospholipid acyltransferase family protein [Bdellovibrio sp. KM01]QLY25498.1 lysophospholipid acyltransferase family protein [Bdellovibrio sp. KM01]